MAWRNLAALAGLLAVAGPIAVHLLRRRQARRLVLPTVRFLRRQAESAVRLRSPSDIALLLVRVMIVACAPLALAQPLLLTDARVASWASRTARVVVVDASESARRSISDEMIAAESSSANPVTTIEADDLGAALKRADAWLAQSPPARREIVVLSDFQRGSLSSGDLAGLRQGVGLRLRRVGAGAVSAADVQLRPILHPAGKRDVIAQLEGERTTAILSADRSADDGLRILVAAADASAVPTLLRIVATAGAAAPSASQPIVVRFPGAAALSGSSQPAARWTFGAGQRLLRSPDIAGLPVRVSAAGDSMIVEIDAAPGSLAAAQVLKAALDARVDPESWTEHETTVVADETLAAWTREPAAPDPATWRQSDEFDGRWFWAAALLLIGVESLMRRSTTATGRRRATSRGRCCLSLGPTIGSWWTGCCRRSSVAGGFNRRRSPQRSGASPRRWRSPGRTRPGGTGRQSSFRSPPDWPWGRRRWRSRRRVRLAGLRQPRSNAFGHAAISLSRWKSWIANRTGRRRE